MFTFLPHFYDQTSGNSTGVARKGNKVHMLRVWVYGIQLEWRAPSNDLYLMEWQKNKGIGH
jgi:hypothetical protein